MAHTANNDGADELGAVVARPSLPFPGLAIVLGGREYILPAISAKASRVLWPRMQAVQAGLEENPLDLALEVAFACLRRNYPTIELEALEDLVDLGNCEEILAKAGGNGSFRQWARRQAAEEAAAGNAREASPATMAPPPGIGDASMPELLPLPDGGSPTSTS